MFSYQLQMTQLRSFLLGILASRLDLPSIISIKTGAVARLFNTAVGKCDHAIRKQLIGDT